MEETNNKDALNKKLNFKTILVENIKYRTLYTEKYKLRKPFERKDNKKLTAFIPGTIREIYIKPRKKVKAGDPLLVLEAMKMKNNILAPINGMIKDIHVRVGDRVSKEQVLIEFE